VKISKHSLGLTGDGNFTVEHVFFQT